MKTTSKNPLNNYVTFKRYTLLIPVVLVLIATIVFAIWGVNKGNDLKTNYSFNIEFNTTISKSDYNKYVDILKDTMKSNDTGVSYTFTKVNEDVSSSCIVRVFNKANLSVQKMEDKVEQIKTNLVTKLNEKTNLIASATDVQKHFGQNISNSVLFGSIALIVFAVIAFVYYWARFELKLALASLTITPYVYLTLFALMIIFRIPMNATLMIPVYLAVGFAYILFTIFSDKMRDNLDNDANNNLTNDELVYKCNNEARIPYLVLICGFAGTLVLLLLLLNIVSTTLILACILGLVVAIYSGVVLATTIWASIYKKEKDLRLKARKQKALEKAAKTNNKSKKDENDKLVV